MAIYHFSGTVISRSGGKSVVASAAYRSGEKLYDERQERVMDYSRKQDVFHKEVLLPEGAPEWMKDRGKLWNAVEKAEKRKDAQLAREFNFALPRELSREQGIELAREFVKNEFVAKGMVADLCIHDGKTKDGEEQPHAHVMLSLRRIEGDGFGLKERNWNAKENLLHWREAWADYANKHLALNDIGQRIDHRSLAEQGIELEPQKKIGPEISRVYEARVNEHVRIARENGEKILEDPTIALRALTYHNSTFTYHELGRFVNRHTLDAEQFQLVYEKVKGCEEMVVLGKDEAGLDRLTTKEMLAVEERMMEDVKLLEDRGWGCRVGAVKSAGLGKGNGEIGDRGSEVVDGNKTIELTQQQREGLEHILGVGDIKCLVGYAGTGKSRLLSQAREIWEQEGYKVYGVTLAGVAAESLEFSSGIESRTFASREYYWDKGEEKLGKKDVLVVDEAGMLGSRQSGRVVSEARKGGAKVVLIGDQQQLQSIEAGGAFRGIVAQTGFYELTEVKRQREEWQQEATKRFAMREVDEALNLYEQHDCVHIYGTQKEAKLSLVDLWNEVRLGEPEKSQIMLAYTRRDVQELNELARKCRKFGDELLEEERILTPSGYKDFAVGERIYFLQNNRELGVKNGTLGTIEAMEMSDDNLLVKEVRVGLDGNSLEGESKSISFNPNRYNHITHGYAATVHKAQAVTVDRSYLLASKHLDSHAAYVGMTRHRERVDMYWSQEEFANCWELERVLNRDRSKGMALDYVNGGLEPALREAGGVSKEQEEQKELKEQKERKELELFQKRFEQENPAAAAGIRSDLESSRLVYNKSIEEAEREKALKELKNNRNVGGKHASKATELEHRDAEYGDMRSTNSNYTSKIVSLDPLVERYYDLAWNCHELKREGKSRFDIVMAEGKLRKCGIEVYHSKSAMDCLRKTDQELFEEMSKLRDLERTKQMTKGLEKGFELER
jgi:Ti-type conjugative transfer relaxase TraA